MTHPVRCTAWVEGGTGVRTAPGREGPAGGGREGTTRPGNRTGEQPRGRREGLMKEKGEGGEHQAQANALGEDPDELATCDSSVV